VAVPGRGFRQESEALLRQIDVGLAGIRAARPVTDLEIAERIAAQLRRLVVETARSSAADRARVCAAVRYFSSRAFAGSLGVVAPAPRTLLGGRRTRRLTVGGGRPLASLGVAGRTPWRPARPLRADARVVDDILHGLNPINLDPAG
jgi:hypothetical protein